MDETKNMIQSILFQLRYFLVFCTMGLHFVTFLQPLLSDDTKPVHETSESILAADAGRILNDYCFRCHRGEGSSSGRYSFNARRVSTILDESMVVEGNPDDSDLLAAVISGRMPPKEQKGLPRPSAGEVQILRQWIKEGAKEFPAPKRRPFMSLNTVLKRIIEHNQSLEQRVRKNVRYFTLANLYNDPSADDRQLRMTRAALAKALNSLSWERTIVVPKAIDPEETIYSIDISLLGWQRDHWAAVVSGYPYEVDPEAIDNIAGNEESAKLRQYDTDMALMNGNDRMLRHLRADWFITQGLRPKLYHKLLYELVLPELRNRVDNPQTPNNPKSMTDRDLETFLGVSVQKNIFDHPIKARRAGYNESGISGQNRMIERHLFGHGYYWKSYDFLDSNSRAILSGFPLGPVRDKDNEFAFTHDGGEIIFSLPNGLQGYLLSTGKGERLDAGPIEIVGDALKTSGNQLIVNGLSCIVCHRKGMIEPPPDEVRTSALVYAGIADRVRDLYPKPEEMRQMVEDDEKAFKSVAHELLGPFLIAGDDKKSEVDKLPEPVGEVARKYLLEPMNIDTVASELFYSDVSTLQVLLKKNPQARLIGLGQLNNENGTIKRAAWEARQGRSLMQQAVDVLGYANE